MTEQSSVQSADGLLVLYHSWTNCISSRQLAYWVSRLILLGLLPQSCHLTVCCLHLLLHCMTSRFGQLSSQMEKIAQVL